MRSRSLTLPATILGTITAVVGAAGAACGSFSADEAAPGASEEAGADGSLDLEASAPDAAVLDAPGVPASETVLATGFADLAGVAATDDQVYVVERSKGTVHVIPIAGGASATFAAHPQLLKPSGVVVIDNGVYWIDVDGKKLAYRNVGGGPIQPIASVLAPRNIAAGFMNGARQIVIAASSDEDGNVVQFGDLAEPPKLIQGNIQNPFDVAVTGDQVVWTEKATGSIWSGKLGASGAQLVLGELGCESIAADARGVYWTRPTEGVIRTTTEGVTVSSLAVGETLPFSIAADASGVYWVTGDGKLRRSTRSELPIQTIAEGFATAFGDRQLQVVALTSKYVVWITSDGRVIRHDK